MKDTVTSGDHDEQDEKTALINKVVGEFKALEAERDEWHYRWKDAEAFRTKVLGRERAAIERFGVLPGEHWTARLLLRFGLVRVRDAL